MADDINKRREALQAELNKIEIENEKKIIYCICFNI